MKFNSFFKYKWLIAIKLILVHFECSAQNLSLDEARIIARERSPYFYRAKNIFERAYWRYNNFKAIFKPQVRLNATVPTFYRSINPVVQPDGTLQFVSVSQANNSVGLNVQQNVSFIGGTIRVGSSLQRTDNFLNNKSSFFLSTPFQLSYANNTLLYNEFRWQKKLEPLFFEIAEKEFSENLEDASLEAVKLFLNCLGAQVALELAIFNQKNADSLYILSKERYKIGTVPQTDILQFELNTLRLKNDFKVAEIFKEKAFTELKRVLGLESSNAVNLISPPEPKNLTIIYEKALEQAILNRSNIKRFKTERLQAEQEIARAIGQNSVEFSLLANLGTQQTAPNLTDSYKNLQNQQYIGMSIDLPILDWGYRKSQIRLTKANRDLVEVNLNQEEKLFEQEIFIKILEFNQKFDQFTIAKSVKKIAQERLDISKQRYLLGKISIAELNLAINEDINAKRDYIQSINNYWLDFYNIRKITMYDFNKDESIKFNNANFYR